MTTVVMGSFVLHLEVMMQHLYPARGGWKSVLIVCGALSVVSDIQTEMLMLPADNSATKAKVCA